MKPFSVSGKHDHSCHSLKAREKCRVMQAAVCACHDCMRSLLSAWRGGQHNPACALQAGLEVGSS